MTQKKIYKRKYHSLKYKVSSIGVYPYDILFVGGTGVGKSSTLNAIFGKNIAKVGYGVDPETQDVRKIMFNKYVRLWDTPGLGDSVEKDRQHIERIEQLLSKKCEFNDKFFLQQQNNFATTQYDSTDAGDLDENSGSEYGFIDMAVVILDAASRDLGTTIEVMEILGKWLGQDRILVFLNRCDMAMFSRHWDSAANRPDSVLKEHLEQQREDLRQRIKLNTGMSLKPIYYSALHGYHVGKVLNRILTGLPEERRKMEPSSDKV